MVQIVQQPDDFARALAVLSLVSTLVLGIITYRANLWRRRARSATAIRPSFRDVFDKVVAAEQNAANVDLLWTPAVTAAIGQLRDLRSESPDRRLNGLLAEFDNRISQVKGDAPPEPTTTPTTMSLVQRDAVLDALRVGRRVETRISQSRRKGAASE